MSVYRGSELRPDGWQGGSYVYFLCCASDNKGFVYVKIGMTDRPTQRLYNLANGCALKPLTFGTIHVYSRGVANKIERELHRALKQWQVRGEWFKFSLEEKEQFAQKREEIIAPFRSSAWPMRVVTCGVMGVLKDARRRQLLFVRRLKRSGLARQDFERHQPA